MRRNDVKALILIAAIGLNTAAPGGEEQPAVGTGTHSVAPAPVIAPLLREGSAVVKVHGMVIEGAIAGERIFIAENVDPRAASHALTLLPCSLLEEFEQLLDARTGRFEATGRVFVHGQRNYLLLTHPASLVRDRAETQPLPVATAEHEEEDDSTEAIIRSVEEAAGPIARRPEARGSAEQARATVAEGTRMVFRRGHVRRHGSGGYEFVFSSDASGHADPTMTLLPCLLLERLAAHEQRSDQTAEILISGEVFTYRGQNYLLPSLFRVPVERSGLGS